MIVALLLMAGTDDVMATYRARTAAERACVVDRDSTDITICGMRQADRYRVPFVAREPGDPAIQDVPAERERLLYRRTPVQELSPFLVGGGMAGVHVSTRDGVGAGEARKLAP